MGSDVPTIRGPSACTSEIKSVRETAASVALPVTEEVRCVTLKSSSVSLESRGSKKGRSASMNANHAPQLRSFPLQ